MGFPRHEFLHELKWWEVNSIIRGYNARHHAGWEQARLVAYSAHYCMGVPPGSTAPSVSEWIKFSWERNANANDDSIPSYDEAQRMRQMMIEENARLSEQRESSEH